MALPDDIASSIGISAIRQSSGRDIAPHVWHDLLALARVSARAPASSPFEVRIPYRDLDRDEVWCDARRLASTMHFAAPLKGGGMKQRKRGARSEARKHPRPVPVVEEASQEPESVSETAPGRAAGGARRLTGGDVDADWKGADAIGDEAVGGSVATPDKDVVDEIGEALGVAQGPEAEVTTSEEILRRRDRLRWHLELEADAKERQEEEQG